MRDIRRTRGFTLIELAIVLTIAGILFAGLWRLLSGGNQQVRDQAAASEQAQLISAVKAFLGSSSSIAYFNTITTANGTAPLPLPTTFAGCAGAPTGFCSYLPPGTTNLTVNSYGQNYSIRVMRDGSTPPTQPTVYSFMIMTTGGDVIPDTSGGRISSFVGGDGGFIYTGNVCGAPTDKAACGAYATWSIADVTAAGPAGYGFGSSASGHIASRTYVSPSADSTFPWLARLLMPSDPAFSWNTMTTDLYMGGASTQTGPGFGNIYMAPSVAGVPSTTGGSNIYFSGGSIFMGAPGTPTAGLSTINLQGGTITGNGNSASSINISSPPGTTISQIAIGSGCAKGSPGDLTCPYSLNVSGDANISSLLNANALYSSTFIYGTVVSISDIRLKTDIEPLADPLADIMRIKPVSYTLKATGIKSYGVIAQDIEKIYPRLVHETGHGLSVEYTGLIAPLIGAVQELKQENDQLRQQLQIQEARQKKLEQEIKNQ